jgi:hypothetical protein
MGIFSAPIGAPVYRAIVTVIDEWGRSQTAGGETVIEQDLAPVNSGLVNAQGVPLYRMPTRDPIGFDLRGR